MNIVKYSKDSYLEHTPRNDLLAFECDLLSPQKYSKYLILLNQNEQ